MIFKVHVSFEMFVDASDEGEAIEVAMTNADDELTANGAEFMAERVTSLDGLCEVDLEVVPYGSETDDTLFEALVRG